MKAISNNNQGEIILFQTPDNQTTLDVRFEEETVWLSQAQMVELFNSSKQNNPSNKKKLTPTHRGEPIAQTRNPKHKKHDNKQI